MAAERAVGWSGSGGGPIHRLVRTLSGKGSSHPQAQPISPVLTSGFIPPSVSEAEELSTAGAPSEEHSTSSSPNVFSGVIDRFKSLSLPGFGKVITTSASQAPRDGASDAYPSPTNTVPADGPGSAKPFPTGPSDEDAADPAEPTYLARKIQALIDALPIASSPRAPTPPKQPNRESSGRPIPPPGATPIKDSTLIAMLSSATVMNGRSVQEERERRVSVWSVLDSMSPHRQGDGNKAEGGEERPGGEDDDSRDGDSGSVFDDTSGIMMYSPLMPTRESLVEIAESGIVETPLVEDGPDQSEAEQVAGWIGMWPFSLWGAGSSAPSTGQSALPITSVTTIPRPASPVLSLPLSPPGSPRSTRSRIPGQRVWVPSTTKLSFQAMWWGYRIYLPPPIMEILDDKQIEAAKRAALITSALTWFFGHIPLNVLPPSVRPVVLLMQTLIPYIGYIGTFISWSWGTIKSYDKGYGVILTTTWLLPVALIPGTWEADTFPPASPPQQPSTPLPPSSPPGSPPAHRPTLPAPAAPTPTPTSSQLNVPVQLQPVPQPQSPSLPPHPSYQTPPSQQQPQLPTPPQSPQTPLPEASEPLPPWVPPPPPPSPPTIPLPDVEEVPVLLVQASPRSGLGVLGKGNGRDKDKGKYKKGSRDGERKKEKGRAKFKAVVASPFSGSRSGN